MSIVLMISFLFFFVWSADTYAQFTCNGGVVRSSYLKARSSVWISCCLSDGGAMVFDGRHAVYIVDTVLHPSAGHQHPGTAVFDQPYSVDVRHNDTIKMLRCQPAMYMVSRFTDTIDLGFIFILSYHT